MTLIKRPHLAILENMAKEVIGIANNKGVLTFDVLLQICDLQTENWRSAFQWYENMLSIYFYDNFLHYNSLLALKKSANLPGDGYWNIYKNREAIDHQMRFGERVDFCEVVETEEYRELVTSHRALAYAHAEVLREFPIGAYPHLRRGENREEIVGKVACSMLRTFGYFNDEDSELGSKAVEGQSKLIDRWARNAGYTGKRLKSGSHFYPACGQLYWFYDPGSMNEAEAKEQTDYWVQCQSSKVR